jgi:succinate dehydrogenase/fumarate reductase flavoprotein subunit
MCEGEGKGIQDALMREVTKRGIEVLTDTRARELITDHAGEVIGVKAERKEGPIYIKAKRGVVICTGHFAHNKKLIELYCPKYAGFATYTASGLEGDGLLMAQALGAAVANISDFRVNVGMVYEPGKALYVYRWCPCILVNKKGRRFINDHAGYDPLAKAILEQEGMMCFVIFDEETRKSCGNNLLMPPLSPDLSKEIELGLAKTAWTISDLGKKIGLDDPATLEQTVTHYNENAKLGKDPEFGSTHFLEPINHPPFYAIKCEPTISAPTGGLNTDQEARVLDVFGRVIPRLYAVGTVASLCPGYPGGGANMVSIFYLGRKAGRNAVREPLRE